MSKTSFYDIFHKKATIQNKVIGDNNFTYRPAIGVVKDAAGNKPGLKVLDYGCGVGTLSLYLASKNNQVVGVDISRRAIKMANNSARMTGWSNFTKFSTTRSKKLDSTRNTYDLILCLEVLEHVENDRELLMSLSKLLKKTGVLIVSCPSLNAPLYRLGFAKKFDFAQYHSFVIVTLFGRKLGRNQKVE